MPNNFLTKRNRKNFLKEVQYNDVPFFSLCGFKTWSKCVKIYDGDTVTLVFYYHKIPYKFRIRLATIDTPELRSKNVGEVRVAILAKKRLTELINDNKLVYVECLEFDKYGRLLANLYKNKKMKESFNNVLVNEGLAYKYQGGKKIEFEDWYQEGF